jgi:hypothetical protein
LLTSLKTYTDSRCTDTAETAAVPQPDSSVLNFYEQKLRIWLSALTPFRKKILAATLQTFDTPLTAIWYTPHLDATASGVEPASRIQSIPRLIFLDTVTPSDAVLVEEGQNTTSSQLFLAVAATDCTTVQRVLASGDAMTATLPITLELLDFTT